MTASPEELVARTRRLLEAATPGPWRQTTPTSRFIETSRTIDIDEADWGEFYAGQLGADTYEVGTLADSRAWRYADVALMAAAPELLTALLGAVEERTRERDEARATAEHWRHQWCDTKDIWDPLLTPPLPWEDR